MWRKRLHIITSLLLIASLQLGAMGTHVSMHYCGDELMSLAFDEELDTCCPQPAQKHQTESTLSKASCCSLEYVNIDGVDSPDYFKSIDLSPTYLFTETPVQIYLGYSIFNSEETKLPLANAPPLLGRVILIRIQKFTI